MWPGEDFHTVYYGWGHGGTVDGSQKGRAGYDRVLADPLSTARQARLLEAQPIAELLGLNSYEVTIHPDRLSSREIRTKAERHVVTSPPCYAELMIDTIVLQSHVLSGRGLNIVYRFRQFDSDPAPTRVFGTYVVEPLEIDLTDKAEPDPVVFTAELERAFNENLKEFAANVKTPRKKKK
ncbi:MAG TPA: hypothetical protein VL094_10465 [Sphingomonadaceae bacterium]|nr:hypothetical protein [Sphingomonadaceae bacterium]